MSRVAVIQSNYIPWKGYFDIIHDAETFVFYDDVQYTKNDWRNRNRIKTPQGAQWLSIPVGSRIDLLIHEVALPRNGWASDHWRALERFYGAAPHFGRYAPALRDAYRLHALPVRGLEHGLAYAALTQGQVDIIDIYTTDPQIARLGLRVLEDDQRYFPDYGAALVYRADLPQRHPRAWAEIVKLQGSITAAAMLRMNAAVELERRSFAAVAGEWLQERHTVAMAAVPRALGSTLFGADLLRLTLEHLLLVCVSLLLSVLAGVPLGVLAQRVPRAGYWVLAAAGVLLYNM